MNRVDELKKVACEAIDDHKSALKEISQKIWEKPELAYNEHFAHQLLTEFLGTKEFKVEKHYNIETAFKAEFGDESKPHVGIMCEYDALPEIGHACGHNLIAEVGLAAGIGIKAAITAAGNKLGKLTVLGCPAEEEGGGKVDLINAGAYKDMDIAMMSHPCNFSATQTKILAMTEVVVTYKGKASHAAGFPWDGINALDAVVLAYTNISALRQQMKPSWTVHGIITNGGAKPNIIPEEAELYYYIRAPKEGELKLLVEKMKNCFESAAIATGCKVEYKWDPKPYSNMLSNVTLENLYQGNCERFGVTFNDMRNKTSGSTDMGNVSHVLPSLHPHYDIGEKEAPHSRGFTKGAALDQAHTASIVQGKALAMTAIDAMCNPELLKKIKKQFIQDLEEDAKV